MLDGNSARSSRRAASRRSRALQPSAFGGRKIDDATLFGVDGDDARDIAVRALPPDSTEFHPALLDVDEPYRIDLSASAHASYC